MVLIYVNIEIYVCRKDIYECMLELYTNFVQDFTSEKCHMVDRPSTSTSRAGRPRTKSAHQTPCVLLGKPKVGRPRSKSALAGKVTDSSKKQKGKKTPGRPPKQVKVVPSIEKRVIEID